MSGMQGSPLLYRTLHVILPPMANRLFHVWVDGLENVPEKGPAILAANHLSFLDSVFMPANVPRTVYFLGKSDYFESWKTRWFFRSVGVIPVYREGGEKGRMSLEAGVGVLRRGDLLGIYPEGTRSPDGRLYRGKTGPVRMAIETGSPIVPIGIVGSREVMPPDRMLPRRRPVKVVYGKPLDLSRYAGQESDPFVLRSASDELMYEIMRLSGQEYVDEYAANVKTGKVKVGEEPRAGTADEPNEDVRRAS